MRIAGRHLASRLIQVRGSLGKSAAIKRLRRAVLGLRIASKEAVVCAYRLIDSIGLLVGDIRTLNRILIIPLREVHIRRREMGNSSRSKGGKIALRDRVIRE